MTAKKAASTSKHGTTANARAVSARGGPEAGIGGSTSGSHRVACVSDTGDTAIRPSITDHIPSFLEPVPPSNEDIPPSSDEESPGSELPLVSPKFMSLPRSKQQWDKVRLPALKNVGKDHEGKVIPHRRSEEIAAVVAELALIHPPNVICAILNLRPGQLKEHYYNELTHSRALADARVGSTAYAMAVSGESESMTKFVAKARLGWRDGDSNVGDGSIFQAIHIHV